MATVEETTSMSEANAREAKARADAAEQLLRQREVICISRRGSTWSSEDDFGAMWDVALGGRVALWRYGTQGDRADGWEFDMESGVCRDDPAMRAAVYPVRVQDGRVLVEA